MTGYEILARETQSWGQERNLFVVSPEEMQTLIGDGANITVKNQDNGDGTFLNSVTFQGKTFTSSSREKMLGGVQ